MLVLGEPIRKKMIDTLDFEKIRSECKIMIENLEI